jgi:predicted nucleic acid-binding protein
VRLVLDSSFIVDHLRGDPAALRRLRDLFEEGDDPIVTEIVVCEVRTGLLPHEEIHFAALLEPMEFVQPAVETALTAGRWRSELHKRGRTLSLGDALIGAVAESLGATVLTRNARDFALMPVPVEVY